MKCCVIDDEPFALDLICGYIERTPFLELSARFSNPFKAMDFLNQQAVDLVFLDIQMPELSGLELYRALTSPPRVIFTTAYPEFAAESYEYNAIDYLLKPIRYDRFLKAVNKATELLRSEKSPVSLPSAALAAPLMIKSGTQLLRIYPEDILYVEAAGNYMCFYTREKKFLSLLTMKEALEILPEDMFVRLHKSYLVSLLHLDAIEKHDVVVGGKKIPIGITYREHFFQVLGTR